MFFGYYKKKFLEGDNAINWGGETISRYWDSGTLYLYCAIILFVFIIGIRIEREQKIIIKSNIISGKSCYRSINRQLRYIFFILLSFLGLRHKTVGVDTIAYSNAIEETTSFSQSFHESTSEPIFKLFQYVFHLLFNNGAIGIFIYAFFTIYFIYRGLKINEHKISLFISLTTYVCLYYFQSFNLLRISLATAFIFFNFKYLLEGKFKKFALIIFIVTFIHYSTLVMFLPLGLYLIYRKHRRVAFICMCLLIIIIIYASVRLGDYLSLINRYSGYIDNNDSEGHIGAMLFIDYLPCIIISFYIYRKKIKNVWADLMICFTSSALIIRLLAYYISAAGRLHIHFICLTMLLLPYWVFYLKRTNSTYYKPMISLCIVWCLFRLHIYFSSYLAVDGIMPYRFL